MNRREVEQLLTEQACGHPVENGQILETHISWVLLTGNFAYKIKKPVDFGFLDFTSLDKREYFCQEELRLNRRFSAELYLDVVPVTLNNATLRFNGDGKIVDFAVRMRQFKQSNLLDSRLEAGEFHPSDAARLGETVASLHQRLPAVVPAHRGDPGGPQPLCAAVLQNFEQITPYLNTEQLRAQLDSIARWSDYTYRELKALLHERGQRGLVRECHGDLHLGNIAYINGDFKPFDCIEFNDNFRIFDVQGEIGFLCMDLDRRGRKVESNACYNAYLEASGDYEGVALKRYYRCYFAMVRAKIALLAHSAPLPTSHEVWNTYRDYADLAQSYTKIGVATLYLMHGFSGSGKTTLARGLAGRQDAIVIRSDVERKRLHGLDPRVSGNSGLNAGIYSQQASNETFFHIESLARQIIEAGESCVIDASFLKRARRDQFKTLAKALKAKFCIISCLAPHADLRRRIALRRAGRQDASDADLEVLAAQIKNHDPLQPDEPSIPVDTTEQQALDKLIIEQAKLLSQRHE